MSKLQAYDFDIEYVKGKHNIVANVLSRRSNTLSFMSIDPDWRAQLLVEYSKDKFACEVLDLYVTDDWYRVMNEVIYYKDKIFLVLDSQLLDKIM